MNEPTYFFTDKNGVQIRDGSVIKVFHFKSRNRTYYMWKMVRFIEKYWVGIHLDSKLKNIPETWEEFRNMSECGYVLPMTEQPDGEYKQTAIQLMDCEVMRDVLCF